MRRSIMTLIVVLLFSAVLAQDLTVRAIVDREVVQENESFTYLLRAEGSTRAEPDLAPLATDFDILQRSRNTSIQMVGGATTQMTEWNLQLMPREAGSFVLPPIVLDGSLSNPVEIEVIPAPDTTARGDIFIEVTATPNDPFVQSQVVYTMTLYRGVSTGRSSLTLPEVSGGEAIIEKLGQDREFQTVFEGRSFIALERRYAIFPQASGPLTLEPVTFEAVVVSPSGFSNVQRYRSDPIELSVRSAVPPPVAYDGAAWLPAQSLELDERWSSGGGELTAGIPQTRTLTIDAVGVLETQLPDLEVQQSGSIRQYGDQPELLREPESVGLRSQRIERFAVLAQIAGTHELPEVELPWFNVLEESWQVARVAASSIVVLPGADEPQPLQVDPNADETTLLADASSGDSFWRGVSAALLALWLVTVVITLRTRAAARPEEPKEVERPARARGANRKLLRKIREACDSDDGPRARRLLLEWAELRFPEEATSSLGALAELLPDSLAEPVAGLERELYGPESGAWKGQGLRDALASIDSVAKSSVITSNDGLLPLYR